MHQALPRCSRLSIGSDGSNIDSAREKNAYDSIIGLLATLDSPQTRFIYNVAEYITDPAAHANAAIIGQQEVIHNESYSYVLASITDLANQNRVFEIARTHPTIQRRNAPIMASYDDFMREKTAETLLRSLIQSSILEGINFYSGFAYFYNLVRQNRMTGTGKIISFINRDELAHSKFISELIRAIIGENQNLQGDQLTQYVHDAFEHAIELETRWTAEVLGKDLADFNQIVNVRRSSAGLRSSGEALTRAGRPTPAGIYAQAGTRDPLRQPAAGGAPVVAGDAPVQCRRRHCFAGAGAP